MKALFFSTLFIVLVSFQGKVFSQTIQLDSIQIERVAKTCQLWGHLKYFHPYTTDTSIDWETAFTDYIDQVITSKNSADFGKAVQRMLDRLNDPVTTVLMDLDIGAEKDTVKHPRITFIKDSILLVSVTDYSDLEDFNYAQDQFLSLKEKMPLSKGVIIDIRSAKNIGNLRGYLAYYFAEIESYFSVEELETPGFKARFYDGFIPESGGTSGGYYSGTFTKGDKTISPATTAIDKTIVFVVNENAEIPMIALALQIAGKAKIISTDPLTDASIVETFNYKLDDSLTVRIRLNELPSDIDLKADYTISSKMKDFEIMNFAQQVIRGLKQDQPYIQNEETKPPTENKIKNSIESGALYPDLGQRLLAAAKIWTVIDYFFAYQDLMEEDWDEILKTFIPRFASASDSLEYHLAIAEMYNHIQDGHGFISSKVLSEYFGSATPPIKIRFIEEQAVIVNIFPDSISKVRGLDIGDIILEIDGEKVDDRFNRYAKITASSNPSWLQHSISRRLLNGKDSSSVVLKIQKENGRIESVTLPIRNSYSQYLRTLGNGRNHEPITKLINKSIGYADLDRLTVQMVDQMFADFKDTKAIIFDMRGYPNGTAWSVAPYLINKEEVYAASFRRYSPMGINSGESTHMTLFNQAIPPPKYPTYQGKTVMLIDERTVSQAEHTGLFFEAANGTKFIGSQTAGANGDVTNFQIAGNITLSFSGHDVRHIDGRQLQKTGLVPDIKIKPTIKGTREGKDEVLQKAIEYVKSIIEK